MRRIADGDDVQQACDRVGMRQTERVREMLREEGRPDLVAELDANLRDCRRGITGARNVWHSISSAQRRVVLLLSLGVGRLLVPASGSQTRYGMIGGSMDAISDVCGIATIRALHSRSLIEATAIITLT